MNAGEFLGIQATHNPHRWYMPLARGICARGGFLYGGAGLAAAIVALEATTERPTIWATAQYLSFGRPPAVMDIDVIVPVVGNNVTQARAIGHIGPNEILTVNAALGKRLVTAEGQWALKPEVPAPGDCALMTPGAGSEGTIRTRMEMRIASGRFGDDRAGEPSADGRSALWCRLPDAPEVSAATLAIIADWMPAGVGHALGRRAGGNSLDNTIRVFGLEASNWVLCDIRVHGVHCGLGHGLMHLWSEQGTLLATASQSFILRLYD